MSAKRYDLDGGCDGESGHCRAEMIIRQNGDWVSHDDYAQLEKEYTDLKNKMTAAIQILES